MSRSEERSGPAAHADNTAVDVLTCPTGHKYEVLEVVFQAMAAGGGQTTAASVKVSGTPYSFDVRVGLPANLYAYRISGLEEVLYPGESLNLAVVGNGAPWGHMVTYIDVDYT